jgi:hypothetical protein
VLRRAAVVKVGAAAVVAVTRTRTRIVAAVLLRMIASVAGVAAWATTATIGRSRRAIE